MNNKTENKEDLQKANWNVQELLVRLDNDRTFLCELVSVYRQDSQAALQSAKAAMEREDLVTLGRSAHTMKGMMRNLLMDRAGQAASDLETSARKGLLRDAQNHLVELEHAMAELAPEVDALLVEVKA